MRSHRRLLLMMGLALLICIGMFFSLAGKKARASQPPESQLQTAAVVLAQREPMADTVVLSGEFRPFQEVEVHAKIAGYIRKIYVDVGDHVRAGQTIAVLEVPELAAQLEGADAAVR